MVGVDNSWDHQSTGEQPDATYDVHTGTERDALLERVHGGVVSGKKRIVVSVTSLYCISLCLVFCVPFTRYCDFLLSVAELLQ